MSRSVGPFLPCRCGGCYRVITDDDAMAVLHSLPLCTPLLCVHSAAELLAWHSANKGRVLVRNGAPPGEPVH